MTPQEAIEPLSPIAQLMELNHTLHQINKTLEASCGLSVVQWSLLKVLIEMPAVSPQVLAKKLGVTPGTLTQTLIRLEKKKFLFMCDDPCDARKKMISITRLGKNMLNSVDPEFERVFAEIEEVQDGIGEIDLFLKKKVRTRILAAKSHGP